ncbi:uncharacterized protein L3040_003844 [Drepanopeziza brunnea f. sp. 'multigermtubi']|uniref:uncharacterized protein n=1 Tax=Drepanopeziza brunnea f. sp. 'multigermtubi' TaxID=698441 RepID=UPI0023912094|nr:hypothetical protein L3040_003844 [Drepanopeziza brunnea f. sp. 'multigermtubi']
MSKQRIITKAPLGIWNLNSPRKFFDTNAMSGKKQEGQESTEPTTNAKEPKEEGEKPKRQKTVLEQDEELKLRLESISGEGGGAGVEYEGGKAVGLKRGVKENMFRVI